ncbi:MAG: FHA domain-containing protein [Acidobacteriota bacterium]
MPETPPSTKRSLTPDWFVQGVLTKIGDTFDRLLGRGWKPSSSLATSELIERLKALLDSEVKETATKARFVPHNITLKMQWDKFSTDAESALRTLENELLAAMVDHINDRRYYTYAPLTIKVKPDYFTSGVKLYAGFEKFDVEGREAEMDVSIPGMRLDQELLPGAAEPAVIDVLVKFLIDGRAVVKKLEMTEGRRISVGRTIENGLTIDEPSVSKIHASLMFNASRKLVVADTGSTNGTFISDVRIPYGKAIELGPTDKLKFGTVEVAFELMPRLETDAVESSTPAADTDTYKIGEFEFTSKISTDPAAAVQMPPVSEPDLAAVVTQPELTAPALALVEPNAEETK